MYVVRLNASRGFHFQGAVYIACFALAAPAIVGARRPQGNSSRYNSNNLHALVQVGKKYVYFMF